jgi:hypothetical protein
MITDLEAECREYILQHNPSLGIFCTLPVLTEFLTDCNTIYVASQ